jgi:hypothetical protein
MSTATAVSDQAVDLWGEQYIQLIIEWKDKLRKSTSLLNDLDEFLGVLEDNEFLANRVATAQAEADEQQAKVNHFQTEMESLKEHVTYLSAEVPELILEALYSKVSNVPDVEIRNYIKDSIRNARFLAPVLKDGRPDTYEIERRL